MTGYADGAFRGTALPLHSGALEPAIAPDVKRSPRDGPGVVAWPPRAGARCLTQAAFLSILAAESITAASMNEAIAVSDCGAVPLRTPTPFDSRSHGNEAAIARDKVAAKADEGGALRLPRLGKSRELRRTLPGQRHGHSDIGKIVPSGRQERPEHSQGGLLGCRRRIEPLPDPPICHNRLPIGMRGRESRGSHPRKPKQAPTHGS